MDSGIESNLVDPHAVKSAVSGHAAGIAASLVPWKVGVALFALGMTATAGWAPLEQAWMAWLAFAVLAAAVVRARDAAQAGLRSLCFALGLHAAGHGWVFHALLMHTEAGWLWSVLGSALFLVYLAGFLAVPAWLCRGVLVRRLPGNRPLAHVRARAAWLPAGLALTWTAGEALRGLLFNGFDTLAAGYLFTAWPLRGWVPVVGVYGCSFLFYASASVAGAAFVSGRSPVRALLGLAALQIALVLAGGAALDLQQWVTPVGRPLTFRLLQGGVPQQEKFDARESQRQVDAYLDAITAAPADLIVTPETTFAMGWTELHPDVLHRIRTFSATTGAHVFVGMPHMEAGGLVKNSVFQIAPGHPALPRYDKSRLMPFGEYAPIGLAWFTQRMSIPLNDQTPGSTDQLPFYVNGAGVPVRVGTLTCHEDASQADARRWASRTELLINPGNLAWFEGTWALPQRLQVAQARALETGRPLLRTTNTGVTAHIDDRGRVVARLPLGTAGVLSGVVHPTTGLTPFARFGNAQVLVLAGVLVVAAAVATRWNTVGSRRAHRSNGKSP
ncbi:MAG: apolipoprotein N-acyltransferase [Hydrogenophaga sp.]|jgi:apolipoprotein N-acyltransferase|uniref:apolipoprotein N-acyltransferase n=1 Tax=Hydrogenophaga sp. TaxID=1904254 RepID=UPI001D65928B|nr:apolipoprotein N-acyltransferase [Hydrogenophaga sp.]MBW0168767.1 apolipoprotein N-acyltransferase [Hydrogenophaga sp.]MBW0183672.1 apolipoprotein N-acyltransferase [Hydrogenophaga sp.]